MDSSKNKAKGPSANAKKIIYVGNDRAYWGVIEQRFKNIYPEAEFVFTIFPAVDKNNYQAVMADILNIRPHIVYVDLSFSKNFQLKVAHFLRRDNATRKIPLVGLVENKSMLKESLLTGMTFTHVKCGEYHDVVFDPFSMAFPKEVKVPQFAKGKYKESYQAQLIDDFLVSYFSPTSMHVEGNVKFSKGQKVQIKHNIPIKMMPSQYFIVNEISSQNMYFDYKYSYDLQYTFVDPPVLDPSLASNPEEQKKFKALESQHLQEIVGCKKKMKEWVKEYDNAIEKKQIKVLIVDDSLAFLKNSKMTLSDCKFAVRSQSFLSDDLDELERIMPNMIAYQLQEFDPTLHQNLKPETIKALQDNEEFHLKQIAAIIKKAYEIKDYRPYLVVFGTKKYNNAYFQEKLSHPYILTNSNHLNIDVLAPMAKLLDQKEKKKDEENLKKRLMELKAENPSKNSKLTSGDVRGFQYFVDKESDLAHLQVQYDIAFDTLSESDLTFITKAELQVTSYRISGPVPMAITVIPREGKLSISEREGLNYRGLIHSIGEDDKKALRIHVNEVFFGPLNEQRQKDAAEFDKKNTEALEQKNNPPPSSEEE